MQFEFLIPKRPVSLQTRPRSKLQDWQAFVRAEASKTWVGTPYSGNVHLTLVYLYDTDRKHPGYKPPDSFRKQTQDPEIKNLYPINKPPNLSVGSKLQSKI